VQLIKDCIFVPERVRYTDLAISEVQEGVDAVRVD
jgi:hypothetical protein